MDVNKLVLWGAALNALEVLDVYKVLLVAVARREQRPAAVLTPARMRIMMLMVSSCTLGSATAPSQL